MDYITTTQLRTNTPRLLTALQMGQTVDLIHRSEVVGEVGPKKIKGVKIFSAKRMEKIVNAMNLKPIEYKDVKQAYRKHLIEKYGKNIH